MTLNVRVGGGWVSKASLRVRSAGAWVTKTSAFKRVGGAWVQFLQSVQLTNMTRSKTDTTSTVRQFLGFASDGTIRDIDNVNLYTWLLGGAATDYQAMWTPVSGTLDPSSAAVSTWLTLGGGGTVGWGALVSAPSTGTSTVVGTVQVRDAISGAVLASGTFTVSATR